MSAKKTGFTLIELLVVISIIAIIASLVIIIIKPMEILHRSRDAIRLSDLANLQVGINVLVQEKPDVNQNTLCQAPATSPCYGTSTDPSSRNSNGTGWVKIKFDPADAGPISAATLPIDPINSGQFVYSYGTNETGDKWEINAVLESEKESWRMQQDGGNNLQKYEIGLSLGILN